MTDFDFPDGFLWGAATAAHQVEGGNTNSDFWALEQARPSMFREPSGEAIGQWHRFADDMAILAALGVQSYRFSIEWARIEPEEGVFAQDVLDHYQRCIDACLSRGLQPMISFHHFTQPLWQVRNGGFRDPKFSERFARYCSKAAAALSGYGYACTINELNLPLFVGEVLVRELKGENGPVLRKAAEEALGAPVEGVFLFAPPDAILDQGLKAHTLGRDAIKAVRPDCKVGMTLSVAEQEAEPGGEHHRDKRCEYLYGPFLEHAKGDDFIGVQTYTRVIIDKDGKLKTAEGRPRTMMGWEDRPEAVAATVRYVWDKTSTPILVTENGWAGHDDRRRCEFIREALTGIRAEIGRGADVRGYYYWSAFDNYEWLSGFGPKFGLIGVDRSTQRRQIKPSALAFGQIARANSLREPEPETPGDAGSPTRDSTAQVGLG